MIIGKIKVLFESGESRGLENIINYNEVPKNLKHLPFVNYMLCEALDREGFKVELYSEYYITGSDDDWDADEGYESLKAATIEQATYYGIPKDKLKFFYDD